MSDYKEKRLKEKVSYLRKVGRQINLRYLSEPVYKNKDGDDICLQDVTENNERFEDDIVNKNMIEKFLSILTDNERKIIELKYYNGMNQKQIAKVMGYSQSNISASEIRAMKKLREYATRNINKGVII